MNSNKLSRFLDAQNQVYLKALSEIKNGKKETHWMWFIFPQLKGLGNSETSNYYGIENLEEAHQYMLHPVLGKHLIEISTALLQLENESALAIFGNPDDLKLKSCLTLFMNIDTVHTVFEQLLQKYFNGIPDQLTLELLQQN